MSCTPRAIIEAGPGDDPPIMLRHKHGRRRRASEMSRRGAGRDRRSCGAGRTDGPVAVDSLWSAALRSLHCGTARGGHGPSCAPVVVVVVARRGGHRGRADHADERAGAPAVVAVDRRLSNAEPEATVVVEIAERLVAIVGAESCRRTPQDATADPVAEEVASRRRRDRCGPAVVLIDAPSTVAGAPALAALIADAVRDGGGADGNGDRRRAAGGSWPGRSRSPGQSPTSSQSTGGAAGSITRPALGWLGGRRRRRWPRRCRLWAQATGRHGVSAADARHRRHFWSKAGWR